MTIAIAEGKPSLSSDSLPRFSISELAKSQQIDCKKLIKLAGRVPSKDKVDNINQSAIKEALFGKGYAFERDLATQLGASVVNHEKTRAASSVNVLREAKVGQILYQLPFEMPESFYEEMGTANSYRLRRFIPDFLWIREDVKTKSRVIFVIDAKASNRMQYSHQFQVASYVFLLSYLIRHVRNIKIDAVGGVWLPGSRLEPKVFRVDLMHSMIEHFYKVELVTIAQTEAPSWIFNANCKACTFSDRCRRETPGTVGAIPYMTRKKATLAYGQRDVKDIEDVIQGIEKLKINDAPSSDAVCPPLPGYQLYNTAYETQKPQFLGKVVLQMSGNEDHWMFISTLCDYARDGVCAYAMTIYDTRKQSAVKTYTYSYAYATVNTSDASDISRITLDVIVSFTKHLEKALDFLATVASRCLIFTFDNLTRNDIRGMLLDVIKATYDNTNEYQIPDTVAQSAIRCMLALFNDLHLLSIPGIVSMPDQDTLSDTTTTHRIVSIEKLFEDNIALGVPGYYTLKDIVEWVVDETDKEDMRRADKDGELDSNVLFHRWLKAGTKNDAKTPQVETTLTRQLDWLWQIVWAFQNFAMKYQKDTGKTIFVLDTLPFVWPVLRTFKSPLLGRLSFFKILESQAACDNTRAIRLADAINPVRTGGIKLIFQRFSVTPLPNGKNKFLAVFNVAPSIDGLPEATQIKLDSLKRSFMKEYILIKDDTESVLDTVRFPDMMYRAKLRDIPGVVTVDVEEIGKGYVMLKGYFKPLGLQSNCHCRLYSRYIDFNADKVLRTLSSMDDHPHETPFLDLILNPNAWANRECEDGLTSSAKKTALKLRHKFGMSPSQTDITASILEKKLQIVWGPPGSGKTEFLALFINWYINHLHPTTTDSKAKPLVIGVTAFTIHAINNLLTRIAGVQQRYKDTRQTTFHIIGMGEGGKAETPEHMTRCKAISLRANIKRLTDSTAIVVGGTVWDWYAVANKWADWEGCDMLIIDESSQLLVSDAASAIQCLNPQRGRLIIAGDHMQLGPILQNDYPDLPVDEPLLFGSIQQCLMRTSENLTINTPEFFLKASKAHEFGPNTIQLKDNWRMNAELNSFFQQIYGDDLIACYPKIKLVHDWSDVTEEKRIRDILNPAKSVAVVMLKRTDDQNLPYTSVEADIVSEIVKTHLKARRNADKQPEGMMSDKVHVMVVTPHHIQRVSVKQRLGNTQGVLVDTVEKMQGGEAELVIACFAFGKMEEHEADFLLNFKRWNVALSRARCKVIVIMTNHVLEYQHRRRLVSETTKYIESTQGIGLVSLLHAWATNADSLYEWTVC